MPKFRRIGPPCIAPAVSMKIIEPGEIVETSISSGWGEDPGWELVEETTEEAT